MKFKKNSIMFWEGISVTSVCFIMCVFLMVYDKVYLPILLFPSILLFAAFCMQMLLEKEHIIMNEEGITCRKGKQLCWSCQWIDIQELRVVTIFRNPSIEIILKECCFKEQKKSEMYFQLGYLAKKAIKYYCNCPIIN